MKQVFGICLSLIYLMLIVGVPITVHHCNHSHSTDIAIGHSASCNCTEKQGKDDNCCLKKNDIIANQDFFVCAFSMLDGKCCSNNEEIISWNSEQQIIPVVYMVFFGDELELLFTLPNLLHSQDILLKKPSEFGLSPPIKLSKVILQHQFIFYA